MDPVGSGSGAAEPTATARTMGALDMILNESQAMIQIAARAFARAQLAPHPAEWVSSEAIQVLGGCGGRGKRSHG